MPESISPEEFRHFHNDRLKDIEMISLRLLQANREANLNPLDNSLITDLQVFYNAMQFAAESGPEAVFREMSKYLDNFDTKQFLIQNMLESLKRDSTGNVTITSVLKRYVELGFFPSAPVNQQPVQQPGQKLLVRKNLWKSATVAALRVAVNAVMAVPRFIELEPQVTVFPVPMLSFRLKGKGMAIDELCEALFKGIAVNES